MHLGSGESFATAHRGNVVQWRFWPSGGRAEFFNARLIQVCSMIRIVAVPQYRDARKLDTTLAEKTR